MRRKPYSQLLAMANAGTARPAVAHVAARVPIATREPGPTEQATAPLSPEAALRCRAELRSLSALVDQHRRSTDAEGKTMCLFVDEKLTAASVALDFGDGDGAWLQLFGAATLCRTFQIQPEDTERTIARLNSMLG
jgi:hypothetical protein